MRLCVETPENSSPSGARSAAASVRLCVETIVDGLACCGDKSAAASVRLCVETSSSAAIDLEKSAAASVRLCVETIELEMRGRFGEAAASVRLCVETLRSAQKLRAIGRSRLRAAVC